MPGPTRRGLLLGGGAALALPAGAALGAAPAPLRLKRGINLWPWFSLTREFPAPRRDFDWPPFQPERPVPTRADLRRLAQAGLDFVRLPFDPGPFLAFIGPHREILLGELTAAIDLCLGEGLKVVVNVQGNEATHHYSPANLYGSEAAPLLPAYRGLVAEIARRLTKRSQDKVALEPVNEPPQACGAGAWTRVQDGLLKAARREAPALTLVATGACGSMVQGLVGLDPEPIRALGPVLFTFHCYEPYLFSHQGAPWIGDPLYRSLNGVPWPGSAGTRERTLARVRERMRADRQSTEAEKRAVYALTESKLTEYFAAAPDRAFLDRALAPVSAWASIYGIPAGDILLGEFGALKSDARYTASDAPDRARYLRDMREAAEAAGFPWAVHNIFDGLGIMDEATRRLDPAVAAALGLKAGP
nr:MULTISPECIES: cellulase family glycosylhydrolase [unclassified Methylobacterium]